jgi:hypothetical protein
VADRLRNATYPLGDVAGRRRAAAARATVIRAMYHELADFNYWRN